MARPGQSISRLINQVKAHPKDVFHGQSQAAHQLASLGRRAVGPVLEAMRAPCPPDQHPRDVCEALGTVLYEIAKNNPTPLVDLVNQGTVPPHPDLFFIVWALAVAPADQVLAPLCRTLKHSDKYVRWAAACGLVRLRSKTAIGPLVEALADRSTDVKFVIVEAMHSSAFFRTPEAIGPLKRIIANKAIEKRSPGLWKYANEVLSILELNQNRKSK